MSDKVLQDLRRLQLCHSDRGIAWRFYKMSHTVWNFNSFRRFNADPGEGAEALREITELADHYGVTLELFAQHTEDGRDKLVSYYEQFGFVVTDRSVGRFPVMSRQPSKVGAASKRVG